MDDIDRLRAQLIELLAEDAPAIHRQRRVKSMQFWISELGLDRLFGIYLHHRYGAETLAELEDAEIVDCGRWIAELHRYTVTGPPDASS